MENLMLKIENVSKIYKLGQIGGTTLRDELQRFNAKIRHKEDPTRRIGAKNYNKGETFKALDGVSFDVKKGERVGIIGHNGAGKSTLLKLVSRITAPSEGTISLNGRVASMLEVGTGFHAELTGRENIYMNGAILGMTKKEIEDKMEDIIEFSECRQFIDTPVKRYSSGMYVKLAFSVAAHLDSEILIMDEVLAVGDMAFQKKCLDKMNDVSRTEGRTILYVSHNMNTIRQLCDRVVVLDHGKVIFDGGVEEGIEIYSHVNSTASPKLDLENVRRLRYFVPYIRITSAEYLAKQDVTFNAGEKIRLSLNWLNLKDIEKASLRVELWSMDDIAAASYVIYDLYSGKKDDRANALLELNISGLAPAEYKMKYVFFQIDDGGNSFDMECVEGLTLKIEEEENKKSLRWRHKYYGFLKLPSPEYEIK